MNKYLINGRFIVRKIGGQERFARELLSATDKKISKGSLTLLVPLYAKENQIPLYKNIRVVKFGFVRRDLWEQIDLPFYATIHHFRIISLTTSTLFFPYISTIHDVSQDENFNLYHGFYGFLSSTWHNLMHRTCSKKSSLIFTVSNFSKERISSIFPTSKNKLVVLGNGWDHLNKTASDLSILSKLHLKSFSFYLSVGSLTPQKNYKWLYLEAKANRDSLFVVVGSQVKLTTDNFQPIPNLIFTGRLNDSEMKALMENCKAFIQSSLYEGFGIPPLEALSCGANLLLSNIPCFNEIFGGVATFFDPYGPTFDISKVEFISNKKRRNEILEKFTWDSLAAKFIASIFETKK
jgi:glycosyltransferase involved in cell wall biosynthesis